MLPKTIVMTFTAVPRSWAILLYVAVVGARARTRTRRPPGSPGRAARRIRREVAPGRLANNGAELARTSRRSSASRSVSAVDAARSFAVVERLVESLGGTAMHDPAEHLDETPVRVPAEALVAGERDQAVEGLLVEAEVEDGVHHAGHRELRARTDADEERVFRDRRSPCRSRARRRDRVPDVLPEPGGQPLAGGEVVVAGCVVIVKPGGTGRPAFVISARPAPLPPSRSRIEASPSARPRTEGVDVPAAARCGRSAAGTAGVWVIDPSERVRAGVMPRHLVGRWRRLYRRHPATRRSRAAGRPTVGRVPPMPISGWT